MREAILSILLILSKKTLRLCATHMPVAFFVILRGVFVSARLGHGVARQGLGLARGLAHWRKGGACRTAAQPLPADAALVFQRGAPDLRGKSKIKLSQISWWKMGDKPATFQLPAAGGSRRSGGI